MPARRSCRNPSQVLDGGGVCGGVVCKPGAFQKRASNGLSVEQSFTGASSSGAVPTVTYGGEYISVDVHGGAVPVAVSTTTGTQPDASSTTTAATAAATQVVGGTTKTGIVNILPMATDLASVSLFCVNSQTLCAVTDWFLFLCPVGGGFVRPTFGSFAYLRKKYARHPKRAPDGGAVLPHDVSQLYFRTVLVELAPGDNVTDIHGFVQRTLASNMTVVLCGAEVDQVTVRSALMTNLRGEGLREYDVFMYVPSHTVGDAYRYRMVKLTVLTIPPLPFKVFCPSHPLPSRRPCPMRSEGFWAVR
jgi:hypothetical protein